MSEAARKCLTCGGQGLTDVEDGGLLGEGGAWAVSE